MISVLKQHLQKLLDKVYVTACLPGYELHHMERHLDAARGALGVRSVANCHAWDDINELLVLVRLVREKAKRMPTTLDTVPDRAFNGS